MANTIQFANPQSFSALFAAAIFACVKIVQDEEVPEQDNLGVAKLGEVATMIGLIGLWFGAIVVMFSMSQFVIDCCDCCLCCHFRSRCPSSSMGTGRVRPQPRQLLPDPPSAVVMEASQRHSLRRCQLRSFVSTTPLLQAAARMHWRLYPVHTPVPAGEMTLRTGKARGGWWMGGEAEIRSPFLAKLIAVAWYPIFSPWHEAEAESRDTKQQSMLNC